jgi:hypothetical protein
MRMHGKKDLLGNKSRYCWIWITCDLDAASVEKSMARTTGSSFKKLADSVRVTLRFSIPSEKRPLSQFVPFEKPITTLEKEVKCPLFEPNT